MGTLASGPRPAPRLCADAFPRLDIFLLNRSGALVGGALTRWQWQWQEATALTIQVRAEVGRLCLSINGGAEEPVAIACQPGTTGNDYPYFTCGCDRRVRFMYLRDGRPACMVCHRLVFASKYRNRWSSSLRHIARLRAELALHEARAFADVRDMNARLDRDRKRGARP